MRRPAIQIDPQGWLNSALRRASPNHDERPDKVVVDTLILHNISLPPGQFGGDHVAQLFCNQLDPNAHTYFAGIASLRVSAHFLIDRGGRLSQFVSVRHRAWHAGVSTLVLPSGTRDHCNDFSVGIELEGCDDQPFADLQYASLAALTAAIRRFFPIAHVRGHSEVAPGRKTDPGPCFDWSRFLTGTGLPRSARP